MLTFIYDTLVVIAGITLTMITWYVVGWILMLKFDPYAFAKKATRPDSTSIKAVFAILVVIPACHLYNVIIDRAVIGK